MATRNDREGAKHTRDNLDERAHALGHDMAWTLGENSNRQGYAYHFVGTC